MEILFRQGTCICSTIFANNNGRLYYTKMGVAIMYDWNSNGKHDSFDDAMFMALLEDDLERHPPGKKTYKSSGSSMSFLEEMGCLFYLGFLIILPLALIVMFLFYGEGDLVFITLVITALLHFGLYKLMNWGSSDKKKEKPEIQTKQPDVNKKEQPKTQKKQADVNKKELEISDKPSQLVRYNEYDVTEENGMLCIKKFVGVDKAIQEVPYVLKNMPVRTIDTGAYQSCRNIEMVIIRDGIIEINDYAFKGCTNLKEVVIPKSVKKIGPDAFPHGQEVILYCFGDSYGLEYARQYKYDYKDAKTVSISLQENKAEIKTNPEVKSKLEEKPISIVDSYSKSYTPSYIPVYTSDYISSSVMDDEPEETVRERLDYDLIGTGYDSYDLEWMDEDERNQILEDNLLDPYDYDFDDLD